MNIIHHEQMSIPEGSIMIPKQILDISISEYIPKDINYCYLNYEDGNRTSFIYYNSSIDRKYPYNRLTIEY